MTGVVPGTLVQMRTLRRFHHYNAGEVIAVPIEQGQELARKRLAQPLHLLVPTPVAAESSSPPRQGGGGMVRK